MRRADLVATTTEPLAAALERRGIAAVIIPKLLDPIDWAHRMVSRVPAELSTFDILESMKSSGASSVPRALRHDLANNRSGRCLHDGTHYGKVLGRFDC